VTGTIPAIPFPRSYWVTPGNLLAGAYPGSPYLEEARENMAGLVQCGIRRIINLMEPDETDNFGKLFTSYEEIYRKLGAEKGMDVSMVRRPIRDFDVPTPELMASIVGEINRFIELGLPVYVHCWGGRGRTGTVIGCWLVNQGLTGQEALDRIRWLRQDEPTWYKHSPETENQVRMVLNWRK
jgi:protein-tyrosine phosphatase